MARKEPTPNYELMFQSAVYGLQQAYIEYKKAISEELRWTFFDNDGHFNIPSGYKEGHQKTKKANAEVTRMMVIVEELRARKEERNE